MKLKKILYLAVGFLCLGLGCVGIVLPILPTVPFFLVTVFCFARASERLHAWFLSTNMYKKHLQSFAEKKGMTAQTKAMVLGSVTVLMGLGFFFMKRVPVGRAILAVVWLCHVVYFLWGVKTIEKTEEEDHGGSADVQSDGPGEAAAAPCGAAAPGDIRPGGDL